MRHCLTHVRMVIIEKTKNSKCWREYEEKGSLQYWWDYKLVKPLWKTVCRSLKELELSYNSASPFWVSKEHTKKTLIQKGICTPMFSADLYTIARIWEQPKYLSMNKWIKKT